MNLKATLLLLLLLFFLFPFVTAQIPDGSTAPDWTLTDIDGNTHTLSNYLNEGKLVILDFSATWCAPCWSYHNSGAIEDLYEEYGPEGTDQVMAFMIEGDLNTDMQDLMGIDPASQGDWITNTPYPIIDLTTSELMNAYQIGYFPTIFAVCQTDNTIYESGQVGTETLLSWFTSCFLDAGYESSIDAICYGEGMASVTVTGGITPYSYSWSNGSTSADLLDVGGGTYAVTVTEANGKITVVSGIEIDGPENDLVISDAWVTDVLCNSDLSGTLEIYVEGGTADYTYQWSNGMTGPAIENVSAGEYTVVITDGNNCQIEQTLVVEEPQALVLSSAVTDEACDQQNGTLELVVDGGVEPYVVEVNGPGGTFNSTELTFVDLHAGDYEFMIVDANGCEIVGSATIEFVENLELIAVNDALITCTESLLLLEVNVSGASSDLEYQWTTFEGNIVSDDFLESIMVDAAGEYFVVVTDLVTGCTNETSIFVTTDVDVPTVNAGDDQFIDCISTQIQLDASGSSSGPDYSAVWTTSDGNILSEEGNYVITVNQPGTYTFTVINDLNGCMSADHVVVTDISEFVNADFSSGSDELIVNFSDISTGGAISWLWDFGDGSTSSEQHPLHTFTASGVYNVCMTATNPCGSETICQEVTVESAEVIIVVNSDVIHVDCHSALTGSIIVTATGGEGPYTYNWSGPGSFASEDAEVTGLGAGEYTVIITDQNGVSTSTLFSINEPELLLALVSSESINCFGDENGSAVGTATGGVEPYHYSWSNGSTSPTIDNLTPGSYIMTVTDANGCQIITDVIEIVQPEELIATATNTTNESAEGNDGGAEIIVNGGVPPYSYEWSNGSTSQNLENATAGSYFVEITDANGCTTQIGDIEIQFSTGLIDLKLSSAISLVPNPAEDFTQLRWSLDQSNGLDFSIFNAVGQVVYSKNQNMELTGTLRVDVSAWSPGIYYITITDGERNAVKRLMVE